MVNEDGEQRRQQSRKFKGEEYSCTPDDPEYNAKGGLSIEYHLFNLSKLNYFPLDNFEGPAAPATAKKLFQIKLINNNKTWQFTTQVNGFYANDDEFVVDVYETADKPTEIYNLLQLLQKGSSALIITLHGDTDFQTTVATAFPTKKAAETIKQLLVHCH